jgi:hypothetical protein
VANASADKLKALALRHGEKAVMAVTSIICVLLLVLAAKKETIGLTADELKQAASSAESNLSRKQDDKDILTTLESQGIKNPGFETIVDQQEKNLLVAADFRSRQLWVTPEPGAGLIRDQPELLAPSDLFAYPGRGGALVFALDDSGNRIPDPDALKNQDAETTQRRSARGTGRHKAEDERKKKEAEKERLAEEARKKALLAGGGIMKKEEAVDASQPQAPMKEITKGLRWVAITGVLNYKLLRDNYLNALKRPEEAYPHFKQLDVERQTKQTDGSWSDWEPIEIERNRQVLDNLPEEDEELTPDNVRISALVAPLPFLKAGFWERVHVAKMVPEEKVTVAPKVGSYEMMPGSGAPMDTGPGAMATSGSARAMETVPPPMAESGMGTSGYGGATEAITFDKTEVDEIMIRALDFTVEPDTTYRFRVRIIVYNPNRQREDISPGVDTASVELFGPWSEPTEEVTMPSDVATYALNKQPPVIKKLDLVNFQVARWNPDTGVTVVKQFDAAPGELIGEVRSAEVPIIKNGVPTNVSQRIDFNSHQLVLDVMGVDLPIPPLGPGTGGRLTAPVVALVVRPDGAVVIRNQASDLRDQVRKDMLDNYNRKVKEADEAKKKKSTGPAGSAMPMPN